MTDTFLTFKTFPDGETAQDFAEILIQQDIPYLIEEDALVFDPSYANNQFNRDYRLKLRQQDFIKANQAFEDFYKTKLEQVSQDYYLFYFTDEELQEIIAKPDEWGHFDYLLAQKLLVERGTEINAEQTEQLKSERIRELSKTQPVKRSAVILSYIVCFFFFPIGLFIGWNWAFSKKTLPDGQRIPVYSQYGQKQGMRIFIIGLILLVLSILLRFILFILDVEY
jgi:hypothetical protein